MTNTTSTTNHQAEQAHDAKLLDLLHAAGAARSAVAAAEQRLLSSASVGHAHWRTPTIDVADPDKPYACSKTVGLDTLPVGTIFWQSKTFNRGEGDKYYVITEQPEEGGAFALWKHALPAQALDAIAAGASNVALHEAEVAYHNAVAAISAHEENYTGWSRYFLVTSSAGHVHSSMHCTTCHLTTTFAPVISLSGTSDAEAIEALGETLCSVCFPEAPIEGKAKKVTKAAAAKLLA